MRLLRRDPASPNPQPDAQLDDDDFPTEIKTVSNLTGGEVSAGLLRRIREGLSQAPSVVIDGRGQVGLSQEMVEEGMKRAIGKVAQDGKVVKRVHVIKQRMEEQLTAFAMAMPASYIIAWKGYLAGSFEWGELDFPDYQELDRLLPKLIGNKPVGDMFIFDGVSQS